MKKIQYKEVLKYFILLIFTVFIGIPLYYLVTKFTEKVIDDLTFATGIMALGTIALAGVTTWNVINRNSEEKRNRKYNLLQNIIEWTWEISSIPIVPFEEPEYSDIHEDIEIRYGFAINKIQYFKEAANSMFPQKDKNLKEYFNDIENKIIAAKVSHFVLSISNMLSEEIFELIFPKKNALIDKNELKEQIINEYKQKNEELVKLYDVTDVLTFISKNTNRLLYKKYMNDLDESIEKMTSKIVEIMKSIST